MIDQLGKSFEGVIKAARFVVELCTQSLLKKWPTDIQLNCFNEQKHKFVAGILKKQRLVSLLPSYKSDDYKNYQTSLPRAHIQFPFAWFRNGLHQQREEAIGQGNHNDTIVNQYEHRDIKDSFLDNSIQRRLSYWLGLRLPQLRVHSGSLFDELLDNHNAHAMTLGSDIYVRSDKYHPESTEGLALLGHEMTHVAQQYSAPLLPMINDTEIQERAALNNEKLVHLSMRADSSPSNRVAAAHQKSGIDSSPSVKQLGGSVAATPMFADAGRSLPPAELPVSASVVSDAEMSRIKQEVYRDIMQKIRLDIERGA